MGRRRDFTLVAAVPRVAVSANHREVTHRTAATFNPIEPVGQTLQPGSITNAQAGDIGMLPEVDGIPCAGARTSISSSP